MLNVKRDTKPNNATDYRSIRQAYDPIHFLLGPRIDPPNDYFSLLDGEYI